LFNNKGINPKGLLIDKTRPTIVKQRIVSGNHQQLMRLDYEDAKPISQELELNLYSFIANNIDTIDVIVISDYAKGLVNKNLVKKIIDLVASKNIPIIADPKPKNKNCYRDVTLMTPNFNEAKIMSDSNGSLEEIGNALINKYNSNILITRSSEGITLFEKDGTLSHFPTKKIKVFDVSGAGDTVVAVSALGLASGLNMKDIANLANIAGRIVVQKPGTSTLTVEELKESLISSNVNAIRKKIEKKWGHEDWIVNYENANYCGKRLVLKKGYQCSIHYHKIKSEVFYINQGCVLLQAYGEEKLMKLGDSLLIEPGTKHRFIGLSDAEIIEFSSHHKDEDSYRDEPSGKIDETTFKSYLEKYSGEMNK
ncbi:cupin domain-containing protein, partial [Candidatus Woesearchaeota archaeon]|nr:cupin domain-containing protein [Candidatus Woesearchaeota archaeon]